MPEYDSNYDEIQSLLTNQPIVKKQVTIGTSARLPVPLFHDVFVMSKRAGISRNDIIIKLLTSAVTASHMNLVASGNTDILAELQEEAQELVTGFWENHDPALQADAEE